MKDVYDLVTTEYLKDVESLKDALARLSKQTLECSYFIQDYVKYTFGKNFSISQNLSHHEHRSDYL
jgi:hypothetical protein